MRRKFDHEVPRRFKTRPALVGAASAAMRPQPREASSRTRTVTSSPLRQRRRLIVSPIRKSSSLRDNSSKVATARPSIDARDVDDRRARALENIDRGELRIRELPARPNGSWLRRGSTLWSRERRPQCGREHRGRSEGRKRAAYMRTDARHRITMYSRACSRTMLSATVGPAASSAAVSSSTELTFCRLTAVTISPCRKPFRAAGLPGPTLATRTPSTRPY